MTGASEFPEVTIMRRRRLLQAAATAAFVPAMPSILRAATFGVTDTEIRIGGTAAYSGPASAYGVIGRAHTATWQWFNDQGGVNGRKVKFLSYDDSYSPSKAIEQVRRLVEQDEVACLCNTLGTAANSGFLKYVNQKQVPDLFVGSGADKFQDPKAWPWTIGWQPSYRVEAQIFAKYALKEKPDAKMGILYQNDDFGKDYLIGFRDVLGDRFDKQVKAVSYEVTDATIESQMITLQEAKVDVLLSAATPKFAVQIIRKLTDMNWKPMHLLSNVSISVGAVIEPAGADKAIGLVSNTYYKDPSDPHWKDDAGIKQWREVMGKYLPGADLNDAFYVYGYGAVMTMIPVLKQCGNDFSRENLMRQASNLKDVEVPTLLPGIKVNTSPTNYHTIGQVQMMRWSGKSWDLFGEVLSGAST
jgi:branched-chain amino acid transport system substrate-binding protein